MAGTSGSPRTPLTRERVLAGAISIADRDGLAALTIRSLATELGVKPMSVYHHVPGKEAILDGIVDAVFAQFDLPAPGGDWRSELRARYTSARAVLRRHPWAVALLESRVNPGPATLHQHDAVLGTLYGAGFAAADVSHGVAILDAFVYGFVIQEATLAFETGEEAAELAEAVLAELPTGAYPHLARFAAEHVLQPGYDFGIEFDYGLDLLLDGLAASLVAESGSPESAPPRI
jgi:AcrR family transcriptional regulator